ncbi:MAG: hypothetical protein DMG75_03965 [Acidobacteria bacterium]|nr:MAG: hypothetical protein DMG75_03965 [Acidobacteriota bacterium]
MSGEISLWRNWWVGCSIGLLLLLAALSIMMRSGFGLTVLGDVTALLLLGFATGIMLLNAWQTQGQTRAFWALISAGFVLWFLNQAGWTWIEVVLRRPIPAPFVGDIVLFIHIVPFMAAIAIRPHHPSEEKKLYFSTLNFLMLLLWWVFLYMFIVFPDEYVLLNLPVYSRSWDRLYLVENCLLLLSLGLALASASGAWRRIYRNLFIAAALYTLASEAINASIAKNQYYTGSLYDVPFIACVCWYCWAGLLALRLRPECDPVKATPGRWIGLAPRLAMLAILSFRLLVTLAAMLALGFFVFIKQYRLDRELIRLLQESQRSYENLERLQSQLVQREKLASLGQLVAGAAHEINNPLAAILGYSELLTSNVSLDTDQLSMARKIGQQARRTRDLVSDLLSFARQAPAEKSLVDLGSLLQRARKMEALQAESKKITIDIKIEPNLPRIWGDVNQLFQVALQIIENAIDALEEVGGGRLEITLGREENELVARFSDTGPGIRDPQRVFDPFYTTKPIGKGTGLGLSATYGVVQDHQGQVTCYNRPEGGAVFVLRLHS